MLHDYYRRSLGECQHCSTLYGPTSEILSQFRILCLYAQGTNKDVPVVSGWMKALCYGLEVGFGLLGTPGSAQATAPHISRFLVFIKPKDGNGPLQTL